MHVVAARILIWTAVELVPPGTAVMSVAASHMTNNAVMSMTKCHMTNNAVMYM